jgi:DNA-binding SARP family transcriptional activator
VPGQEPWHETLTVHMLLIKAAASDEATAYALVERAAERVAKSDDVALRAMVGIVQTHLGFENAPAVLRATIEELAQNTELVELRAACEAVLEHRRHPLLRFLERFQGAAVIPASKGVQVHLLRESLSIGGRDVALSRKDLGLVAYLSKFRRGVSREELQDALWPELDGNSARDALYSSLYRLRKRSGSTAWIENIGNAYRLSAGVNVDLWEIETIASRCESRECSESELAGAYELSLHRNYPHLEQYEWFAQLDFKIREASRKLATVLVNRAFDRGDLSAVMPISQGLLNEDPCDEWAQEVHIRALISQGDFAGAARAYRRYRDILSKELSAEPSVQIQSMVRTASKM